MEKEITSTEKLRSFIGIPLTRSGQKYCESVTTKLRTGFPSSSVRWVAGDNLHLTLSFLGDQHPSGLDILAEKISMALTHQTSFDLQVNRLCAFPDAKSRILALEFNQCAELFSLKDKIQQAMAQAGIQTSESHSIFRPHVTLGRFKSGDEIVPFKLKSEQLFIVQSVVLFESVAGHCGVQYRKRFQTGF